MQRIDGAFIYAASDLNNYLECKRLTELETLVACGKRVRPSDAEDEQTRLIRRKGEEHERRFLETMQSLHGGRIVSIERPEPSLAAFARAEQQTFEAMAAGAPIVYQATFFDGLFIGHADFLRRIDAPSRLGAWSYEVLDTKLALNPKPYFLIQLCNYAEHLERLQGVPVVHGCVILGDGTEARYRLHDYAAYYRHLKSTFLAFAADAARTDGIEPAEYPYECKHCTMCAWDGVCKQRRIDDDHLSLVAWMRRDQIAKLETAGIASLATLAHAGDEARPQGLNGETFQKLRRQARLQADGRERGAAVYELLPHAPPMGFTLMPEPATGDVFFDMEGDPLFEPGHGLEYLFGCCLLDDAVAFRSFWGLDRNAEKRAFEEFVDFIVARRLRYPSMHVYHYASYEKSAVRKLAQAHCTRESEIDDLLRGEVLVDLYAVVRQALAISEERYGLKNLERFYPLVRATEVKKGDQSIVMFERWLETGDRSILDDIEAYNRDDCESTYRLREWLLARRDESIQHFGVQLPFRPFRLPSDRCHPDFLEGCSKCAKRRSDEREEARRSDLERTLLQNLLPPQSEDDYRAMAEDARARYLLGNLLAYHRREEKPGWWAYFDRCENVDHLLDDREAIGGLKLEESVAPYKHNRSWVYTYSFPDQHHKLGKDDTPHDPTARKAGTIIALDEDGECNVLALKWNGNLESARAIVALIPRPPLATKVQRESLERIAGGLVAGTLRRERPATFDLLMSAAPRLAGIASGNSVQPQPVTAEAVSSVVRSLDRSYLFIQGPPGSGKTTTAAHVICDLLQNGKRVGVTSTGHKAIHNLLDKVESEMRARHARFRGLYKCSSNN
ncbi:MAG: TM0106 family RecB-like putative nuclease, partial [Candidatus Tumulicola sp.]